MSGFTSEELSIAKSVDLVDVASCLGYTPKKIGRYYTLKEMDSIRIYNRSHWYRWSMAGNKGHDGGSQIDFLKEFAGLDVKGAVFWLLDFAGYRRDDSSRSIHFMFGNKPLTYISTESESEARKLGNQDTAVKKKGLFGSALPGTKISKKDEEFEKKFGKDELSPEAQALADKVKKEDFEAMKKKMKTMVIAVVIGVIAMIAAIIVKKFVL